MLDPIPQDPLAALDIHKLLQAMVDKGASDLHLTVGAAPMLRVDGALYPLKIPPLRQADVQHLCYSVLTDSQKKVFEERSEIDLSFQWKDRSRFRANFFRQRGNMAGALRQIPQRILSFE